nr:2-oxo-4-hydroxy-4-carboxy-5-ureidoimidazoline decarboxylase [Paenibacillus hamazuiensis]
MKPDSFVSALGWIFEHSPWVAERCYGHRPFADMEHLHARMTETVELASDEEQLALIRAHPDLASKLQMSAASVSEQHQAGLTGLSGEEYERFTACNREYTAKFGFPFIMAVRGRNKGEIMASMLQRLGSSPEEERRKALSEIAKIARFRLADTIAADINEEGSL